MTNAQLVAEAERKIQDILLQLECDWEGPAVSVQSVGGHEKFLAT
jgi:hypothetical protein